MAGAEEAGVAEVEVGDRHVYARMPILSRPATFSRVPYLASPVTWRGWMRHRKMVLQSRSSIGRFSVTSEGVTRALRMILALPPSTTLWTW